ncbi:MAG: Diacylglycerol kinase [Haliscomenobacter sp.]|nr:Diacylglycerol kinase [Haliscomenobacter sp.]
MNRLFVIYNPQAGRGKAQAVWPQIYQSLLAHGMQVEIQTTNAPLHAKDLAMEAAGRGFQAVVAVGGDGTIHEVANGLLQVSGGGTSFPMGIIPVGNGDDFIKMLPPLPEIGQQGYSWAVAVARIASGKRHRVDVGSLRAFHQDGSEAGHRYFVNGVNLGFSAHAAFNFSSIPRFLTGFLGYLAAVLKTLWKYPLLDLTVQVDGLEEQTLQSSMVAIMNGRCFGRAFWVCPQADVQDGLLDMMIAKKINQWTILQKIPLMMKGSHLNDPLLQWFRGARISIASPRPLIVEMDGEVPFSDVFRVEIETLPGRLEVLV